MAALVVLPSQPVHSFISRDFAIMATGSNREKTTRRAAKYPIHQRREKETAQQGEEDKSD
jgi:hypothetical protein